MNFIQVQELIKDRLAHHFFSNKDKLSINVKAMLNLSGTNWVCNITINNMTKYIFLDYGKEHEQLNTKLKRIIQETDYVTSIQ